MASRLTPFVTKAGIHRRSLRREHIERLLALASYLADDDRLIVEQVFAHGIPLADVARISRKRPRVLQKRFVTLVRRTRQPIFTFVVNHRETFTSDLRQTATLVVLHGRSLRQTACATGATLHVVRRHVQSLHALAQRAGIEV